MFYGVHANCSDLMLGMESWSCSFSEFGLDYKLKPQGTLKNAWSFKYLLGEPGLIYYYFVLQVCERYRCSIVYVQNKGSLFFQ